MLVRALLRLAAATCLTAVLACGGGGGGGSGQAAGAAGTAGTGSVAVQITDGPVPADTFSSILLTFTEIILIGEPGQVTIFQGRETLDLRDFEDAGKLVTVGRDVPAGVYHKIRMEIEDIELVPADGSPSIHPKLPPKIDFNPQRDFRVHPKKLLVVQADFDAGKSIHVVLTGNGGYRFRPVVFVDILAGPTLGKLVLLQGVVEDLDLDERVFLLCDTDHAVSKPFESGRATEYERDDGDVEDIDDFCVEIAVLDRTSIFDRNGDPAELSDLANGDEASVLGRFVPSDEDLLFAAEVIQQGPPGTARVVDGQVLTGVGPDDRFAIDVDPGQGFVAGTKLEVQLQETTKIFSRRGRPLEIDDIQIGNAVRVVGLLVLGGAPDWLKASVVVIDLEALSVETVSGRIFGRTADGARLEVETEAGFACVDVPESARVYAVSTAGDEGFSREIDRSELRIGDEVNAYGTPGDCLSAEIVTTFLDDGA